MIALWFALAAAAGYTAGHYRWLPKAFEWVYDRATDERWYSEPVAFLMLLVGTLLMPRRTIRGIRATRHPEQRLPAPEMDPNWGTR